MFRKIFLAALVFGAVLFPPKSATQVTPSQVRQQEVVLDLPKMVVAMPTLAATSEGISLAETETSAVVLTPEIVVPLENAEPFLAVAPLIQLTDTEDTLELRYRFKRSLGAWEDWSVVDIDHDVTPRGSSKLASLLFLPKDTASLQFQITLQRNEHNIGPTITSLKVSFISPGVTTPISQKQITSSNHITEISPESSTAKYPKPIITSRTDWGCPDGQSNPRATPNYTNVTHLIVHHTAGSNTSSDWAAVVRSIWSFHIFTNGWNDIGYNYLIDPNGVIYEGRAGGDNVMGAHFSCQNSGTMGVALLGTFTSVQPATAALNSLKELLSWKADQRNIDPAASSFHNGLQQPLANISGHRDGNGLARSCTVTECPGEMFYRLLPGIRIETKNLVSPVNDFSLTTKLDKQLVARGSIVSFSINSSTLAGTAQKIDLSLRNLPPGLTFNFVESSITTGNSTQLYITVPETTPSGTYALQVIGTGTTKRAVDLLLTVTGSIASVSAASYLRAAPIASESIVSAFGTGLASETKAAESRPLPLSLADISVKIKDHRGTEWAAPLFFVSPTQINYQVPSALALGSATVTVLNKAEVVALGALEIVATAPGLFSANANGQGAAAGALQRRKADGTDVFEPLSQFDETQKLFLPRALDLRTPNEQYFLTLYGTGIRFRNIGLPVVAQIGGTEVEVLYAGNQQEFIGLDQVNLRLTTALVGRGTVELRLQIDGQWTNALLVSFK